jgi:hypothetical protein
MEFIKNIYIDFLVNERLPGFYIINALAIIAMLLAIILKENKFAKYIKYTGILFCILHLIILSYAFFYEEKIHGAPYIIIFFFIYSIPLIFSMAIMIFSKNKIN